MTTEQQALAHLRTYALTYPTMGLSEAIRVLDEAGTFAALDEAADTFRATAMLAESAAQTAVRHSRGIAPEEALQVLHNTWQRPRRHGRRDPLAEKAPETGYAAVSRLGSPERVPGTDTLRPVHEHAFLSPHSDEVCYGADWCTLTYREFRARLDASADAEAGPHHS